ncbi:RHS repeat-associated core domain-containing protein [Pseudomonas sp. MAG733B]|uniref:RHS repeat-associated core domain-containing protein n=1 Tax=Pseudomonas sp. MAG733B TaxID=3122079 RepID=UPI0030D4B272
MSTNSRRTILLATDHQHSVLSALVATRPHPIAYTPYGHRPAENGLLSLLGFNGELPDPMTGHYHLGNGYRQFNPVLMRFNSPDSWSPFGDGGLNAYGYCDGDPRNRADATGHVWWITKFLSQLFGRKPKLPQTKNEVSRITDIESKPKAEQHNSMRQEQYNAAKPAIGPTTQKIDTQTTDQPPTPFYIDRSNKAVFRLNYNEYYVARFPLTPVTTKKLTDRGVNIHASLFTNDKEKANLVFPNINSTNKLLEAVRINQLQR